MILVLIQFTGILGLIHQIDTTGSSSGSGTGSGLDLGAAYFPTRPIVKFFEGDTSEGDLYTEDSVWTVTVTQYQDDVKQSWKRISQPTSPNAREQVDRYLELMQRMMFKRDPTPTKRKERKRVSFKLQLQEPFYVRSDEEEEAMWESIQWDCKAKADLI